MEQNLKNLLEAEQDVNRKVQDALNQKNTKLRSIKDSAKGDIDAFKKAKEAEYSIVYEKLKKQINEGDQGKGADNHQSSVTMETIERDYAANKELVIDLLVSNVLSVNIEIPKVVKGTF